MKKNLLYQWSLALLALFFFSHTIFAKPVNPTVAAQVGKHFFQSTKKGRLMGENVSLSLVYGGQAGSSPEPFFVFNVNGTEGFVIVAADDAVHPILGYSNEGAFNPDNIPEALRQWLLNNREEILYVREHSLVANAPIREKWTTLQMEVSTTTENGGVGPLLQTKWNQSPNENMFCPGGSLTGCAATAMAQVMYYWQHPAQGLGSHSYVENDYGTLTADFGATVYQWGLMAWQPTTPDQWISTLMLHCGISINMNYSPSGSGISSSSVIADALKKYFKYDPNTVAYVQRSSYSNEADWINLLKQELNANRPMEYQGVGDGGGHAFVCDGYDDNNLFHMNWGWAGSSDGFFNVSALNPGTLGSGGGSGGYNNSQGVVIGVKPDPNLLPDLQMLTPPFMGDQEPFYGEIVGIDVEFANTGGQVFNGDVTLGIYNAIDGNLLSVREDLAKTFFGIGGSGAVTSFVFPIFLPPGNYNAVLMYRNQGVSEWQQVGTAAFPNQANFLVHSTSPLNLHVEPTSISPNPVVQGQSFNILAHFINLNPTTYTTTVSANLHRLDGTWIKEISQQNLTMGPAAISSPLFSFPGGIFDEPGTYKLIFWEKATGLSDRMVEVPGSYTYVDYLHLLPAPAQADVYEPNNSMATAALLPLNFSGNIAFVQTFGANNHTPQDGDYYRVNFPFNPDFMYKVTGRLYDLSDNSNGGTYTNDCIWRYSNNGAPWSAAYDDQLLSNGGEFFIRDGFVLFYVQSNFAGTSGNYFLDIEVTRIPAIDHPCGAIVLPVNGQPQFGFTNATATASIHHEPNIPPPGDCTFLWCDTEQGPRALHTVWFKFQAPASGKVGVSTCNLADFDTQLAIYSATDCNDISTFGIFAANDDGNNCDGFTSIINGIGFTPGQTYYIMVDGYENAIGNLGIKLTDLEATSIENLAASPDVLSVSPNPTMGLMNIQLKGEGMIDALNLTDVAGKTLLSQKMDVKAQSIELDLSDLPNGVFLLQVRTGNQVYLQKVVVQR